MFSLRVCVFIVCFVGVTFAKECCPDGYFGYGEKCYRQFVDKKTYREAYTTCADKHGSLWVPWDTTEWERMMPHFSRYTQTWIGLHYTMKEGITWIKEGGMALSSVPFLINNQENGHSGSSDCAAVYSSGSMKNQVYWHLCALKHEFFCEIELEQWTSSNATTEAATEVTNATDGK